MENKRDSMIFYRSFFEAISGLPKDNKIEVFDAVFEYSFNFVEVELTGISKVVFTLIKPQLQANNKKFENGKKAKTKQTVSKIKAKQKQTGSKDEANVNVNVNVNKNVNSNLNENNNSNKNEKELPTEFGSYQKYLEIYNDFFKEKTGLGLKFDGAQGKALKQIISYLKANSKECSDTGGEEAWKYILANWSSLEPFIQDQLKITQINSNLPNILNQLKNGKAISKQRDKVAEIMESMNQQLIKRGLV